MRNKQKQYEYQSVQVCTSTVSELAWNDSTVGIFAGFCRSPGQNFNNIRAAVSQNVWNNKAWLRIDTFPMNPCLNPSCPYLSMSKLNASQCLPPLPGNAGKLEICEGHQDLDLSWQSLQSCDLSKFSIVQPLISVPGCSNLEIALPSSDIKRLWWTSAMGYSLPSSCGMFSLHCWLTQEYISSEWNQWLLVNSGFRLNILLLQ